MINENVEKELNQKVYRGLFRAGFFKKDVNTEMVARNLKLVFQTLIEMADPSDNIFLYTKRLFELSIEAVERFRASKEQSFNALTLN